ncbi:MAG: hypothetical protein FWF28_09865, partial [Micrococcales bacterium]|nr:hypothetical protein [Micrococcales bacterium]
MRFVRRLVDWLVAAVGVNVVWWCGALPLPLPAKIAIGVACVAGYALVSVRPRKPVGPPVPGKTNTMLNGYELLLAAGVSALANLGWWIWLGIRLGSMGVDPASWVVFVANVIIGAVLTIGLGANGFIRIAAGSTQVPITTKVLVVALWWFPPATAILLGRVMRTVSREALVTSHRAVRDQARLEAQVCRTRYPVLLVHGIFFRDWSALNYWGRIPAALTANGAVLHYGGQQSSASVADSGIELAAAIRRIVDETGCGKVNIIAHSKGGLDSRWAISQLALAGQVASLTTINTPHHGCNFARQLMDRIPQQTIGAISSKYDALFTKLGDPSPDFLAGVDDLTDT